MQKPPPLSACLRYPITTGVAALAVLATLRLWTGADIERFMIGYDNWWLQPWRLLTPTLFHGNTLHLLFNLCWLWVFGTRIEEELGSGRTLGIYVLLALGSTTADQALFGPCIGLSGVVYGLFGLLWILGKSDPRFLGVIDRQTWRLLVGWFFLCIVLTVANVFNVANVAHAAGFLFGVLLAWTMTARSILTQVRNAAILAALLALCVVGGTAGRPYVNLSSDIGRELHYLAIKSIDEGDLSRAANLYERAVASDPNVYAWWFNLGIVYERLDRTDDAVRAFERAAALDPQQADLAAHLRWLKSR